MTIRTILAFWDKLHKREFFPYSLSGYREKFKLHQLRVRAYRKKGKWLLVFEQVGVSLIALKRQAENWIAVIDQKTEKTPHWKWIPLGPPARAKGKHWLADPLREKGLGLPAGAELVFDGRGKELLDSIGVQRPSESPYWRKVAAALTGEAVAEAPDPLERDLRAAAKVRAKRPLTPKELASIKRLRIATTPEKYASEDRTDIHDLSLLSTLRNLESLEAYTSNVTDIGPLATLTNLKKIDVTCFKRPSELHDISPLEKLKALEEVALYQVKVADLRPLSGKSKLRRLSITAPVEHLPQKLGALQYLDITSDRLKDGRAIATMKNLVCLELKGTALATLDFVRPLRRLRQLSCSSPKIRDLSPLRNLPALESVDLVAKVKDLSPLLTLKSLQSVDLPKSHKTNRIVLALEERGVHVTFGVLAAMTS